MQLTVKQLLATAYAKLQPTSPSPALDTEILLAHVLKKPREFLFAHPEFTPLPKITAKFHRLIKRRALGEPIAYLVKNKEFFGLNFFVDKRVLVPRPETELLVEETIDIVIKQRAKNKEQAIQLIDIGTGSGCIPISILKSLQDSHPLLGEGYGVGYSHHDNTPTSVLPLIGGEIRDVATIATDISPGALTVARRNARAHHVKIKFLQGNLLQPIFNNHSPITNLKSSIINHKSSIIITANLPYLPTEVCHRRTKAGGWKAWKNNCSMNSAGLKFEPPQALYTGKHGLQLYKELFTQIRTLLLLIPCSLFLLIEFDPRQTKLLRSLIKRTLPNARVQIKKDLAGLDRVAIIKVK